MIGKNSRSAFPVQRIIISLLTAFLITGVPATAAEITLAWNPNTEPDLSGYKIYSGTASRSYSGVVDVGNWTSCVMSGLEPGKTYYFAAKAYAATGLESDYSGEVVYSVPVSCCYSLSPASQTFSSSGGTGNVSVSTGSTCGWTAFSSAPWLTVTAGSNGAGPGYVSFAVSANPGSTSRTASLAIGGQAFTVTQSGYAGSFTISASGGQGGCISPAGASTLPAGGSRTYTITPNSGYNISAVQVDGANIGAVSAYTFANVSANHSIRALFKKQRSKWTFF